MAKTVRYHPLFDADVIEVANWYDERSAGLGDAFAASIERAVTEILSDPTRFATAKYQLRYHRAKRFPFIVLFDVISDELLFLGDVLSAGMHFRAELETAPQRMIKPRRPVDIHSTSFGR